METKRKSVNKVKSSGLYLPEMASIKQIAAIEGAKAKKPIQPGTYLRQIVQKAIRDWQKKNPGTPLTN